MIDARAIKAIKATKIISYYLRVEYVRKQLHNVSYDMELDCQQDYYQEQLERYSQKETRKLGFIIKGKVREDSKIYKEEEVKMFLGKLAKT